MNDLSQYLQARSRIHAGDVIVFSGSGGVSPLIEFDTDSCASHVAVVRQAVSADIQIIESTIEGNKSGVQTNQLQPRLANYDSGGRAWWLPLSDEARKQIDWFSFYEFCGATDGHVAYDIAGLFKYLARQVPLIGPRVFQSENTRQMFCSGFVVQLFEHAGLLRGINASKTAPQDLVEMKLYRDCVQILGAPAKLARFNTL